jgi:hypothetical protein
MAEDRIEPGISDDQLDAWVEGLAREEEDELARAWGRHILDAAASPYAKGRIDEDQALLDALGQARLEATESEE